MKKLLSLLLLTSISYAQSLPIQIDCILGISPTPSINLIIEDTPPTCTPKQGIYAPPAFNIAVLNCNTECPTGKLLNFNCMMDKIIDWKATSQCLLAAKSAYLNTTTTLATNYNNACAIALSNYNACYATCQQPGPPSPQCVDACKLAFNTEMATALANFNAGLGLADRIFWAAYNTCADTDGVCSWIQTNCCQ